MRLGRSVRGLAFSGRLLPSVLLLFVLGLTQQFLLHPRCNGAQVDLLNQLRDDVVEQLFCRFVLLEQGGFRCF